MPEQNSIPDRERLALSVLLAAGADPRRLARWYADNSDHPHNHITHTIDAMKGTGLLQPVSQPGRGKQLRACGVKPNMTEDNTPVVI